VLQVRGEEQSASFRHLTQRLVVALQPNMPKMVQCSSVTH